uniref:Uncharacterized protein n=1 Tax=Tetradesmus obliquus TaxID=3088 RepID=A0A383V6E2_TETOB|eukprot:jgi/Sobl393_1/14177/SZX60154.1
MCSTSATSNDTTQDARLPHATAALPFSRCCRTAASACRDSDTELLPADYVSAQEGSWRGSESWASFLRPLPADVKLHTLCKVCSKERANKCAGCGQAACCSRDCQTQVRHTHSSSWTACTA